MVYLPPGAALQRQCLHGRGQHAVVSCKDMFFCVALLSATLVGHLLPAGSGLRTSCLCW